MSLYLFAPGEDPGPDFVALLRRVGDAPALPAPSPAPLAGRLSPGEPPLRGLGAAHGTTIVALRYAGGVAVAGDRRATEGYSIAHRNIEKVFPADRYSAVAIAGAAGPALEMVRLFQVQLEHYEKVEGSALSLEGKANQLGQMVRAHLPLAMEGLGVVPLFAGYDTRRQQGRIFTYDLTGGRYEEADYHATGSGGRDAKTTVKLGFREGLREEEAVRLAVSALFEAAESDAATGGPDPLRGIYPIVAVVDRDGYRALPDEVVAEHFARVLEERRAQGRAVGSEEERP